MCSSGSRPRRVSPLQVASSGHHSPTCGGRTRGSGTRTAPATFPGPGAASHRTCGHGGEQVPRHGPGTRHRPDVDAVLVVPPRNRLVPQHRPDAKAPAHRWRALRQRQAPQTATSAAPPSRITGLARVALRRRPSAFRGELRVSAGKFLWRGVHGTEKLQVTDPFCEAVLGAPIAAGISTQAPGPDDCIGPESSGWSTAGRAGWRAKGGPSMIAGLNLAVDDVELHLATDASAPVDAAGTAVRTGTTEHHLRRMFSSLAGMPLSDYVRPRRDVLGRGRSGEYRRRPSRRSPSGTATARPRRSGGHFMPCTAPIPAMYGARAIPYAHNRESGPPDR